MEIVTMKVTFEGIYFWGSGWKDDDVSKKWYNFWVSNKGSGFFWKHFLNEGGSNNPNYLVCNGWSSYLHPMGFDVVYRNPCECYKIGENGERVRVFNEIDELKDICDECARVCGCSVKYSEPKIHEINT